MTTSVEHSCGWSAAWQPSCCHGERGCRPWRCHQNRPISGPNGHDSKACTAPEVGALGLGLMGGVPTELPAVSAEHRAPGKKEATVGDARRSLVRKKINFVHKKEEESGSDTQSDSGSDSGGDSGSESGSDSDDDRDSRRETTHTKDTQ